MSAIDDLSKIAQYLFESDQYLPENFVNSFMQQSRMLESEIINNNTNSAIAEIIDENTETSTNNNNSSNMNLVFSITNSLSGGQPDLSRPLIRAWFLDY